MSQHQVEKLRFGFAEWIAGFDTRLVEFLIALVSMLLGLIAIDTHRDGSPIAPHLKASLKWFAREPEFWAGGLMLLGIVLLLSLAIGTRRTDDTRPRASAMSAAAAFYLSIAISTARHADTGHWLALFYGVIAGISLFSVLVLVFEAMIQRATAKMPDRFSIVDFLAKGDAKCNPKTGF